MIDNKLKDLIKEIVTEVYELQNSTLLFYQKIQDTKYTILPDKKTPIEKRIFYEVVFDLFDYDKYVKNNNIVNDPRHPKIPYLKFNEGYNVGFSANGETIKYADISLKELGDVFFTIIQIIKDFISYKNPAFLFIDAEDIEKHGKIRSKNENQKIKIYNYLIVKHIAELSNWKLKKDPFYGILLYDYTKLETSTPRKLKK